MRKKKYNHLVTFHEYLLGSCPHISVELAFQNQAKFQFHGLDTLWGFRATGGTKGRGRPAGRKELISLVNYTYYFLRRHDREWLEANQPPSRKPSPPPRKVDWKGEDAKLAAAIKLAAGKILKVAGRPARVSKASIIRGGRQSWIEQHLQDLPRTAKVLAKHLESNEDFLIRRIEWAQNNYLLEGVCPTRRQLTVRAGTGTKTGTLPRVQAAIDSSIDRLQKSFL